MRSVKIVRRGFRLLGRCLQGSYAQVLFSALMLQMERCDGVVPVLALQRDPRVGRGHWPRDVEASEDFRNR